MAATDLEARLRTLEARLGVLEDVEAIRLLKARYGELVDERYAGGAPRSPAELDRIAGEIAELFTEDALWEGGAALGTCRGRAAIRERFAAPTLAFSWHYFVKPRIEVTGDSARARWDLLAPCTSREGRAMWMAGVEDDDYRRVDGRWLHQRMALRVVFLAPHDRGWGRKPGPP
jgi:hypothetical protein